MGDLNSTGYEKQAEDAARAVCFGNFLSFFFMQQFVTQPTRKCAILHWVLSENSSLVTEVELCEGL